MTESSVPESERYNSACDVQLRRQHNVMQVSVGLNPAGEPPRRDASKARSQWRSARRLRAAVVPGQAAGGGGANQVPAIDHESPRQGLRKRSACGPIMV
jgi:hypothetical protein